MFKLESAKTQLWLECGEGIRHWEKLQKKTRDHPFNHAVELFVPGVADLPADLRGLSPPVYFSSKLQLSQFIQPHLYSSFPSHSLCALTVDSRIDIDNVYALLPSGKLILSVDKDTYEQLGLVGKASHFQKQHRFIVEVDLTAPHFQPGKPNYDRVKWSFAKQLGENARYLLCHLPTDMTVDTATKELLAVRHECVVERELLNNFQLPTLSHKFPRGQNDISVSAIDCHTWLGAVSCGIDVCGDVPDDYVSTYQTPEPHTMCQYGTRIRWTGMIHSEWVCDLLCKAKHVLMSDNDRGISWIAVNVWGFEDSPISWNNCEHGSLMWGDNHYTVMMFKDEQYWTLTSLGTHDVIH